MNIRTLVSPLALAVALSFSGGAMAQSTIGGVDIPAEDLPQVQSLCNSLMASEGNASLTDTDDDAGDDSGDTDDGNGDGDNGDGDDGNGDNGDAAADPDPAADDEPSGLDQALTTIDLDTITLQDCRDAGLV